MVMPDAQRFVGVASMDTSGYSARKKPLAIRVGMRGQGRIVIGRRSAIQYGFHPIRQLNENMTE